jgi:phosphate transport system substrate-binding protein
MCIKDSPRRGRRRSGTGGGFQKFIRGDIDINNASREIQESEAEVARENDIEYIELSVAYDGLSVVVHPDNDWVDYITVEELKKIWEPEAQGNITHWNDVREEWPDEPINLYGPGTASGTYDYFTEAIVGESGASRGDFTASEDDNVLVQGVSTDENALGFFGLAYYEENSQKLRLVPVKDGDKDPVIPTIETVAKDEYTPLSRPLFIYVTKASAQRSNPQNFVNFYLDNISDLARDVGYVAMPDSLYQVEKEKFEAFYTQSDTSDTTSK